jgi:hypothetical protein
MTASCRSIRYVVAFFVFIEGVRQSGPIIVHPGQGQALFLTETFMVKECDEEVRTMLLELRC